jgi:Fe-S cluster assembly protein SufD
VDLATDLLTLAFIAEAVDEIEDEALRDEIVGRVEAWLMRRRG